LRFAQPQQNPKKIKKMLADSNSPNDDIVKEIREICRFET